MDADGARSLEGQADSGVVAASLTFEEEVQAYREFFAGVMNGFRLSRGEGQSAEDLYKVNALAWWYTHNMLVHYSVPHGLEQYGGAAWGTRDVCQGPMEYFMATRKIRASCDILKMVYSHQYEDDGNWPQWFMFDKYFAIQQEESHGDIIVWPLKVLGDYLTATRRLCILDERVPYTVKHSSVSRKRRQRFWIMRKRRSNISDRTSFTIRTCLPMAMATGMIRFSQRTQS